MKITEKALLRAIGNADEKMVAKAAPLHWNTESDDAIQKARVPKLSFRKITELVAVCAACCICIGTVLMVHRMYSNPAAPISDSASEQEARDVLESFLKACENGNMEEMKRLSLDEYVIKVWYEPEQIESGEAAEGMREHMQSFTLIKDFKIGIGKEWSDSLQRQTQFEQDSLELYYYYYYYEKNDPKRAKEFVNENSDCLRFYQMTDKAYDFSVETKFKEPGHIFATHYTAALTVFHYNGEWVVYPALEGILCPRMSESGKEKLAAFREKYGPVELPLE